MAKLFKFYTPNDDDPKLNDESTFELHELCLEEGVVTLGCNDDLKSYKVTGPCPTKADLEALEEAQDGNALCADDPRFALEHLGLTNEGETGHPEDRSFQPFEEGRCFAGQVTLGELFNEADLRNAVGVQLVDADRNVLAESDWWGLNAG